MKPGGAIAIAGAGLTREIESAGYVRLVGRRRADSRLEDPVVAVPVDYKKTPLMSGTT